MRTVVASRAIGDLTIVDSGLVAGEQVVTDGQSRLTPGAKVDIKGPPKGQGRGTAALGDTAASARVGRPAK